MADKTPLRRTKKLRTPIQLEMSSKYSGDINTFSEKDSDTLHEEEKCFNINLPNN